jgi:hypothetical protein
MSKFRPSPALIVSTIALLVASGGASYAAFTLPRNSVGTKQIKNKAVTLLKIAPGAQKALAKAGPQGPPGVQGPPGSQGQPGAPGQNGTALAYAHVNSNGTVDGANSKGVTASTGPVSLVSSGLYCLTVSGTPHVAVATVQPTGTVEFADANVGINSADINAGYCLPGTNVEITTWKGFALTDGQSDSFYVEIN